MDLFGCATCKAKDEELVNLRKMVNELHDKLLNLADPLLQARLAASTRVPSDGPNKVRPNPYLLRRQRADRGPVAEPAETSSTWDSFKDKEHAG